MDEIEIKQIAVDSYSYIKGVHLGLLMARDLIKDEEDKRKLTAASIDVHNQALNLKKSIKPNGENS
jgi:hypothetical protein